MQPWSPGNQVSCPHYPAEVRITSTTGSQFSIREGSTAPCHLVDFTTSGLADFRWFSQFPPRPNVYSNSVWGPCHMLFVLDLLWFENDTSLLRMVVMDQLLDGRRCARMDRYRVPAARDR